DADRALGTAVDRSSSPERRHVTGRTVGLRARTGRATFVAALMTLILLCVGPPIATASASGASNGTGPGDSSVDWPTYGFDVERSGDNPAETGITIDNASQLHQVWSTDM